MHSAASSSTTSSSTASSSTASSSTTLSTQLVQQFKPSKSFRFPKRKFGNKGEERSFRAAWSEKYDWLHYDVSADAAFCYLCMRAEHCKIHEVQLNCAHA